MLGVYRDFMEDWMAMPVITGQKTECREVRRRAAHVLVRGDDAGQQGAAGGHVAQPRAELREGVRPQVPERSSGGTEYAWNTSWGVSTRLIGGLVMTHGDDNGLRMPPLLAPIELVIVPIYQHRRGARARARGGASSIATSLGDWERREPARLRVHLDARDGMKPGAKYYEWELRGIPLRLELGPRDLDENQGVLVRRDTREKRPVSLDTLGEDVAELLIDDPGRHARRGAASAARRTASASASRYDEFRELMDGAGGVRLRRLVRRARRARRRSRKRRRRRSAACPTRSSARPRRRRPASSAARPASTRPCGRRRTDRPGSPRVDGDAATARACRSTRIAARRRHAGVRVQRGDDARPLRAARRGARAACRIACTTRSRPTRTAAILRRAARARRRRGRRLRRRAVSRAARRLHAATDIIFGGVGKTERELREALDAGVLLINVESEAEVRLLDRARAASWASSRRVGAARESGSHGRHAAPTTSRPARRAHKFGIPYRRRALHVARLRRGAAERRRSSGSTCTSGRSSRGSIRIATARSGCVELLDRAARRGRRRRSRYLDIGGGLGVSLRRRGAARPRSASRGRSCRACGPTGLTLIMEPGRFVVGNAGVLLTRVLYRKHSGGKDFVVTDAGMTELLRPSHYDAYHRIEPVRPRGERR